MLIDGVALNHGRTPLCFCTYYSDAVGVNSLVNFIPSSFRGSGKDFRGSHIDDDAMHAFATKWRLLLATVTECAASYSEKVEWPDGAK